MNKQLELFPEFDNSFNDEIIYDYKREIINILELLVENGEVNLLYDEIPRSRIEFLIKSFKDSNE